ncbi:hypothetical protein ADIAL_0294 [Alkalibacterium sp. AK22]|uniref:hypothetical protein n=1 Tax=Alkalibacterium sp. AK22 TaxID=1229520 RepID=UPI00044AAB94|nr:hypothetical protein [Alkalibacterium sp. AK22]EXJ24163.1 hypothetical protein ADIAL_0294 [Alkalibacterium sp. AK22]
MGDQIEFPKNYGTYMHHAMRALQTGNYGEAISDLEKAYAIKDDNSLNVLLVSTLYQNGQLKEALELAEEKEAFYVTNEKRYLIYAELLIQNGQLLKAQKHIDPKLKDAQNPFNEKWIGLQDSLNKVKQRIEEEQMQQEKEKTKRLFALASVLPEEQLMIIREAKSMRTNSLIKAASSIFQNPYVHPLAKSSFLSLLTEREVSEEFLYNWFDQTRKVRPLEVIPLETDPLVAALFKDAEKWFEQNPSLLEFVQSELNVYLVSLFPFIGEVIQPEDTGCWIRLIAEEIEPGQLTGETVSDEKQAFILSWINDIRRQFH